MADVLLVSTYELGRQPFALASPAAWLEEEGFDVELLDLAVESPDDALFGDARLIGIHLPMHTATRLAVPLLERLGRVDPDAHVCAYGLYAPVNEDLLRELGVDTILGPEFEGELTDLARRRLRGAGADSSPDAGSSPSIPRLQFRVPRRDDLPDLDRYAHLRTPDGERKPVGYTEASRGCKHLCRHCPVVPVYEGTFRVVQPEVVLEDVARQVERGAEHVTFGDPDFLNGPRHAEEIVRRLDDEHPELTYDVTVKVEHLLRHRDLLPLLVETGCAFVTSAVESFDDEVLERLDKGHTREDVLELAALCEGVGLVLQPTFVAFHPWTSRRSYLEFLDLLEELDWVDHVPPIQLALRLLVPAEARLLELQEIQELVEPYDPEALGHPWRHPDPAIDRLQESVEDLVQRLAPHRGRRHVFDAVRRLARHGTVDPADRAAPPVDAEAPPRVTVPYLTEPWYC